ncbi:MAG: cupredoxin domain-containing protein [Alphaproteobacteria bacterium]|nr:MAG: cupredoxin domain-containing protein [Alphaproteobacteria bacterium]
MLCLHGASKRVGLLIATTLALASFASLVAEAADPMTYEITLKDQKFAPAELKVSAGTAFIIKLKNENDAPAEFESKEMKFEKVVAGHAEIVVKVKALPKGIFKFVDEYHEDTALGTVEAE